jgi:hypothetical protein
MNDEELRKLVDALALQAVGWFTEAEQKQYLDARQTIAKRVGFLRKESEIALLEARLAQLKEEA